MSEKQESILLTVFTDPMMGLSYESQPILDRLEREFAGRLSIRYVMSVLVRDVSDFMTPEEAALEPEEGIRRYCRRLAEIYKSEIPIGNLPMNMEDLRLFDPEHRSSRPLCLAVKAAELTDPAMAAEYLKALRRATVLESRPTTHMKEIWRVARETGLDEEVFLSHLEDGSAQQALGEDLAFTRRMGVTGLPSYLISSGNRTLMFRSFRYEDFLRAVRQVSEK